MPPPPARRTAALAVGLAAAGYLVARRAVERGATATPSSLQSGFARTRTMATLGGRAGRRWALHKARRAFADDERRQHLDTEFEMRTAAEIAETLGHMKGAMMKLGQMASYSTPGCRPTSATPSPSCRPTRRR